MLFELVKILWKREMHLEKVNYRIAGEFNVILCAILNKYNFTIVRFLYLHVLSPSGCLAYC